MTYCLTILYEFEENRLETCSVYPNRTHAYSITTQVVHEITFLDWYSYHNILLLCSMGSTQNMCAWILKFCGVVPGTVPRPFYQSDQAVRKCRRNTF